MKTSNLITLTFFAVLLAFSTVLYTSCSKGDSDNSTGNRCKSVTCANGGTCNEGKCLCVTGYEGSRCEILARQKFMGTWVVTENRTLNNIKGVQYTLSVITGPNLSEVRIKNLYNLFEGEVNAFVKADSIFVPKQDVEEYRVEGKGWIKDAKVVLKYKVTNDNTGDTDFIGFDGGDASIWNK